MFSYESSDKNVIAKVKNYAYHLLKDNIKECEIIEVAIGKNEKPHILKHIIPNKEYTVIDNNITYYVVYQNNAEKSKKQNNTENESEIKNNKIIIKSESSSDIEIFIKKSFTFSLHKMMYMNEDMFLVYHYHDNTPWSNYFHKKKFDEVYVNDKIKTEILQKLEKFNNSKDLYEKMKQ
jgi:hypothetical protein